MLSLKFYSKSLFRLSVTTLLSLYTGSVYAQVRKIDWHTIYFGFDQDGNPMPMISGSGIIPHEQDYYLPYIQLKVKGYSTDVQLKNIQLAELTKEEIQKLEPILKKARLKNDILHGLENKSDVTLFLSPAIVKSGGGFKKIISYETEYTLSQPPARSPSSARIQTGNSILSSGEIFRIGISREGIYRIDANFLNSIGLNTQGIDPRNIAIYGNGGQLLPQANSAPRIQDLYENAIYAVGETDGVLDASDYFLFYARGPHPFFYNQISAVFQRERNVFCDTAYYFIKVKDVPAKRLQVQSSLNPQGSPPFTEFNDRMIHEIDQFNYLKSGRMWVGESFNQVPSRSFSFNIPGMDIGFMRAIVAVTGRSPAPQSTSSTFTTQVGATIIGTQSLPGNNDIDYGTKVRSNIAFYTINQNIFGGGSSVVFNLSFNKGVSNAAEGHLDYILVNSIRSLRLYGNMTPFRVTASTLNPLTTYRVGNMTADNLIWDVTNPLDPVLIQYNLNQNIAEFTVTSDTLREFVAMHPSNHPTPTFFNKVANQNLRATQPAELVVITHPAYKTAAENYANFRSQSMGISTAVVTTHDIFHEFSSGGQDVVAIRDFLKMLYDRPGSTLKYLLLFGDASFDYKYTTQGNTNFVPTYPSFESLNDINSYASDDFFGFLDDNEGNWNESGLLIPHFMDIATGRLPVRNLNEANNALAKAQLYESLAALGNWRNRVTFMADHKPLDGQFHLDECERFSRQVEELDSAIIPNKIYLDAFDRILSPNGQIAPDAINQVNNAATNGSLLITYYGHGNTTQLSADRMLNLNQINSWPPFDNLPFWITATCDFGKFDDPAITSGSELLVNRPNSGGIGTFTTSRPVFTTVNSALLNIFFNEVFKLQASNPIIGNIYRDTKNKAITGINGRNLLILGDPTIRLALPREKVKVTSVVNLNTGFPIDTLNALSVVQLTGEIVDRSSGQLISNFNGQVNVVVYDAPSKIRSQGLGTVAPNGQPNTRTFSQWNNFVFNGQATVINGTFSIQFIVPLQISYSNEPGKINLYARQANSTIDANGHRSQIVIAGSDTGIVLDNKPPLITLFMDDESFVSGGTTGNNTTLLARFNDDQGIALGSLPGQQIEGILNKQEPLVMNEYYVAKENSFREGSLDYPLKDLSPGNYSMKVKARDTHNNLGEASIEFVVASNESLTLNNIFNYPNPFSDYTLFHFDHNKAGSDLDVLLEVFTVSGRLIKTLNGYYPASKTRISDLAWNARDDFGDKLAKGVYIYKLTVRAGSEKKQEFQKLVILN